MHAPPVAWPCDEGSSRLGRGRSGGVGLCLRGAGHTQHGRVGCADHDARQRRGVCRVNEDDVDARFRSLIETEFGSVGIGAVGAISPLESEPEPEPVRQPELISPRSWSPAEESEADGSGYRPEPLPPMPRLSSAAWFGIVILGAGLLIIAGILVGLIARWWGLWVGLGGVALGILVLFSRLPNERDDDGTGGAVV